MLNLLLQRRRIILLILMPLMVAGIYLYTKLPVNMYPVMRKPTIMVRLPHASYTAEDFHFEFSEKIEERLNSLDNLDNMEATYSAGRTQYKLEFEWNTDFKTAKSDVESEMNSLMASLPDECENFSVYSYRSSGSYMTVAVYSSVMEQKQLYDLVEPVLRGRFSHVKDAEEVTIENVEVLQAELYLRVNDMLTYGLTPETVASAIKNGYKNISIGTFKENNNVYNLRIKNGIDTVFDIENIIIKVIGNKKVLLKDVADVSVFYGLPSSIYTINGERGVIIYAEPKEDGNIKQMADDIKVILEEAKKDLPDHITFYPLIDPSEFIDNAIMNVVQSALLGALLAVFVILLFLGEWRNTLIIVISIPVTMIMSFVMMYIFGVTVNLISLSGMTLAVGMVIDSAIVVMENIHRHRLEYVGKDFLLMILDAVSEVRGSVIASTLTSICVFFPLSFTAPLSNAILGDIARTVVFALTASIFTGLVVTPVLAYYFYRNVPVTEDVGGMAKFSQGLMNHLIRIYESGLRFLLKSKTRCVIAIVFSCLTLFLLLIFVAPKITREIIANPKSNRISIRCSNSIIKDIEEFLDAMQVIEQKAVDVLGERLVSRYTNIRGTNWANIIIVLPSSKYLDDALDDLKDVIQNDSEWDFSIAGWDPSSLPLPRTYGLHIQVSGKDNLEIVHIMEKISDVVKKANLYRGTSTSPSTRQSDEIMLLPRRNELEHFPEFSISKLASMIKILLNGTQVIKVSENNQTLYVYLEYPEEAGRSIEDIMKYQLPYENKAFPFSHFFDYEKRHGVSEIRSDNGVETFNIYAHMNRGTPDYKKGEFEAIIKQRIAEEIELPPGYSITFVDTQQVINEAVSSLFSTIIICVILIYMVLGIQFNSLRIPIIILTSIPLGLIGVVTFLFMANSTISLNSLLGTILLSGIVVNNAIIIIDFYIAYRDKYQTREDALVMVGRLRFTPILITTMTTLLGMLPIALALGDSTNIVQPLGIAVCGGLAVSTFLTLLLLPAILNLFPEQIIIKKYKN